MGRERRLALLGLALVEARAQHIPGGRAVLVLRTLRLAGDDDARRDMGDAHRRFRLVYGLAARARGAIDADAAIPLADRDDDAVVADGINPDRSQRRVPGPRGSQRVDAPAG